MKKILLYIATAVAVLAKPEPIELTRQQASDLFVALCRIEGGLSAGTTVLAADNINALKPIVDALDKGKVAAQRQSRLLFGTEDREARTLAIVAALEAKANETVAVQLERLELTPAEIEQAKIRVADLAVIRQFLRPKK